MAKPLKFYLCFRTLVILILYFLFDQFNHEHSKHEQLNPIELIVVYLTMMGSKNFFSFTQNMAEAKFDD